MQDYLIIAYDGGDAEAMDRRMSARPNHLAYAKEMKEKGNLIEAGAILDDYGKMIGSTMLMRFDAKGDLDNWLENDPYVRGDVWKSIDIKPLKLVKFE